MSESENYVTSESSKSFAPLKTGVQAPSAGTGRRKEAIARVRIVPGNGKFVVNGKELAVYFPNKLHQQLVNDPFKVLGIEKNYDVKKILFSIGAFKNIKGFKIDFDTIHPFPILIGVLFEIALKSALCSLILCSSNLLPIISKGSGEP